jgi:biopolymer transport protein ExbD
MFSSRRQFKLSALRRKNNLLLDINLWGFASVMLAILFLMMPGSAVHPRTSVDMAVVRNATPLPGALKEDAIVVKVCRDGAIFFRDQRIAAEDLPKEIRERVQNGAENRIYLAVDARAKYSDTKRALDQMHLAGIENVSLLSESRRR